MSRSKSVLFMTLLFLSFSFTELSAFASKSSPQSLKQGTSLDNASNGGIMASLGGAVNGLGKALDKNVKGLGNVLGKSVSGLGKALDKNVKGLGNALGKNVNGLGKALDKNVKGLGKLLDKTGNNLEEFEEVAEVAAEVAIVAGGVFIYVMADSHAYHHHYHHNHCHPW